MQTDAKEEASPKAGTELAVETILKIARTGYGARGQDKKSPTPRRSKDEIITMARETCDRIGLSWDK
jgi:hypothetical protein